MRNIIIFLSLLTGCMTSQKYIDYREVNEWGKDHPARIYLIKDTLKYFAKNLFMTDDSTSWHDTLNRSITLATYKIEKIEFRKTVLSSVVHALLSGITLAVILAPTIYLPIPGFLVGLFLGNTFYKENVFIFYPDPIIKPKPQ